MTAEFLSSSSPFCHETIALTSVAFCPSTESTQQPFLRYPKNQLALISLCSNHATFSSLARLIILPRTYVCNHTIQSDCNPNELTPSHRDKHETIHIISELYSSFPNPPINLYPRESHDKSLTKPRKGQYPVLRFFFSPHLWFTRD